jgi:hypothetical protein
VSAATVHTKELGKTLPIAIAARATYTTTPVAVAATDAAANNNAINNAVGAHQWKGARALRHTYPRVPPPGERLYAPSPSPSKAPQRSYSFSVAADAVKRGIAPTTTTTTAALASTAGGSDDDCMGSHGRRMQPFSWAAADGRFMWPRFMHDRRDGGAAK